MKRKILKVLGIITGCVAGLVMAAFAVYVFLYYHRKAEPFEINTPNPTKKVLIATQSTEFKNALIATLCDSLRSSSAYVKGLDVGDLSDVDEVEWDRILIVSSFVIRLNGNVDRFVSRSQSPGNILVYVTSGGADWQPHSDLEVDALTSASRKTYASSLISLIIDWIDRDGDQKWVPDDYLLALQFFPGVDVNVACEAIALERDRYSALYPNLATWINHAGYKYLRLKRVSSALEVFKLNVSLFPDDWNVYDSYGEALLINGDTEEAIRNYKKAVELNPDSKSANDMLKKLGAV